MTAERFTFFALSGTIVFVALAIWIPFRAGRRPLAIYDQGSAVSVLGTIVIMAARREGLSLWAGGAGGLLAGLAVPLILHLARHRIVPRSEAGLLLFYAGSFALYSMSVVAGTYVASSLIGA